MSSPPPKPGLVTSFPNTLLHARAFLPGDEKTVDPRVMYVSAWLPSLDAMRDYAGLTWETLPNGVRVNDEPYTVYFDEATRRYLACRTFQPTFSMVPVDARDPDQGLMPMITELTNVAVDASPLGQDGVVYDATWQEFLDKFTAERRRPAASDDDES